MIMNRPMANDAVIKVSFLLIVFPLILSNTTDRSLLCPKNDTLLETAGDAIFNVFADANRGRYCNVSSAKGLQQISTALYVVRTLNEHNYVPGRRLGLRVFDTCHDGIEVFKRVLRATVEGGCAPHHETGILVPSSYGSALVPLRDYGGPPIVTYAEQNFTLPVIDILTHYLSTRYVNVDLALANTVGVLERFLRSSEDAGVCVRHVDDEDDANVTEAVIVAIGEASDIRRWLGRREGPKGPGTKTWFLLPLDNSGIDDVTPAGSYIIKPETLGFDREYPTVDEYLRDSGISAERSPYLLGIGKAVVGLAEVFQDIRGRNCPSNDEDDGGGDGNCTESQFRPESRPEIRDSDVYEALRMQPSSHSVRYAVAMKTQHDLVEIAFYGIAGSEWRALPEKAMSGMPALCLRDLAGNCEDCANFQNRPRETDTVGKSILKSNVYVPICLIAVVCGTLACCVIVVFIVYRFASERMLDGNPTLTIALILANVFTLLTALPFCMADDYFGAESLNARRILLATLAFGLTFSIMLSRALFLALPTGGVFVSHVNGYLQTAMVFFMSAVQLAISIMYFVLNTTDSAAVARSLVFIALLGYDIFLLIALFVTCCFITEIKRNYREGKCFFGTAVGLLVVWTVWLISFVLIQPENRDAIVSFGAVSTAYSIILGILVPRIYYMTMHPVGRKKNLERKLDLPTDSTISTVTRQSRPSYDYAHPAPESQILRAPPTCPNYYGDATPSSKCPDRCRSTIQHETPGYSNYGFHAEMTEIEIVHAAPQTRVENAEVWRDPQVAPNNVIYAQPKIRKARKKVLEEGRVTEIACDRDDFPSIPKLRDEPYPVRHANPTVVGWQDKIDEENEDEDTDEDDEDDQEDDGVSRVTRL
ncbi:PREDICTED: protein bride of sevenless [Dinoponera quadriceps]|uniref:Protein bride of sevenless n=1 Tax=Dinoponera quadriceps TaxID=609295 RepID=A0A6P3Y3R7_DINQU|nr:PREDICTED: protein bride of sevenless [Dinoponera quadriceps]